MSTDNDSLDQRRLGSTLTNPLIEAAHQFPGKVALITEQESLTYTQLLNRAWAVRSRLAAQGLRAGDIVVLDDIRPEAMIMLLWACSLGNLVAFPLNTRFPETTLSTILMNIKPALVISERLLVPELSITYHELLSPTSDLASLESAKFDLSAAATLLMTSGSTGSAKIVQHSHLNHLSSALGSNQNIFLKPDHRWLLTLPLYHVGGISILYRGALSGAAVVLPTSTESILTNIFSKQITHISLVAAQLRRMLQEADVKKMLGCLQAILLGGSAIPKALIQKGLNQNLPLHVSYGSTEMASQITTTSSRDRATALVNSGMLLEGRDLIISHLGEILVKGDTLAMGYIEASQLLNLRDLKGWFHTGDVGYLDVQGALTVTGRIDNQFISGGENIQPEHIERSLCNLSGIAQAIVLPLSDQEYGFRPAAYLQIDSVGIDLDQIISELKRSLPGYMIPVAFYQLPPELMGAEVKISRQDLSKYILDGNKPLHPLT
ncbi:MAG: o-succinylbenzoate--CoA ligase [Candidatus Marinimicrobia bacterium]|nr:o-succinylbenzoate--CoA ligase [Candidatus Neomarinimicrobiota bacterium]